MGQFGGEIRTMLICLPHEIVECDDRAGDIQRRVENIGEVVCEGIPFERVGGIRSLLVGHGFPVDLGERSEHMAYPRRSRVTSC